MVNLIYCIGSLVVTLFRTGSQSDSPNKSRWLCRKNRPSIQQSRCTVFKSYVRYWSAAVLFHTWFGCDCSFWKRIVNFYIWCVHILVCCVHMSIYCVLRTSRWCTGCDDCKKTYVDGCPDHGTLAVSDRVVLTRALASLPTGLAISKCADAANDDRGIFMRLELHTWQLLLILFYMSKCILKSFCKEFHVSVQVLSNQWWESSLRNHSAGTCSLDLLLRSWLIPEKSCKRTTLCCRSIELNFSVLSHIVA